MICPKVCENVKIYLKKIILNERKTLKRSCPAKRIFTHEKVLYDFDIICLNIIIIKQFVLTVIQRINKYH